MWNTLLSKSFDKWAETYDSDISRSFNRRGITYKYIWERISSELNVHNGSKLLEIGAGTGALGEFSQVHDVIGLDISQGMLQKARKGGFYKELLHCSANRLPFLDETFDGIYTTFMFHSERKPKRLLEECYRVLKPNTHLVLVDLFPRNHDKKKIHWLWSNLHSLKYEKFAPSLYKTIEEQSMMLRKLFSNVNFCYIDTSITVPNDAPGFMSHGMICGKK